MNCNCPLSCFVRSARIFQLSFIVLTLFHSQSFWYRASSCCNPKTENKSNRNNSNKVNKWANKKQNFSQSWPLDYWKHYTWNIKPTYPTEKKTIFTDRIQTAWRTHTVCTFFFLGLLLLLLLVTFFLSNQNKAEKKG